MISFVVEKLPTQDGQLSEDLVSDLKAELRSLAKDGKAKVRGIKADGGSLRFTVTPESAGDTIAEIIVRELGVTVTKLTSPFQGLKAKYGLGIATGTK
jgi:hypothetical protein